MDARPRRQIALFVTAVVLPSALLVVFGWLLSRKERELAEVRLLETQQLRAAELSERLFLRLNGMMLDAIRAEASSSARSGVQDPAVVLMAPVIAMELVLPWETVSGPRDEAVADGGDLEYAIREGERAEFLKGRPGEAVSSYRRAVDRAVTDAQKADSRLRLARALARAGDPAEALDQYRLLRAVPIDLRDEHGVPFSFYAIAWLMERGLDRAECFEHLQREFRAAPWMSPAAAHMLAGLARSFATDASEASRKDAASLLIQAEKRVADTERLLDLRDDLPALLRMAVLALDNDRMNSRVEAEWYWIPYAEARWLVGVAPSSKEGRHLTLIADSEQVLASVRRGTLDGRPLGRPRLIAGVSGEGVAMGQRFPGLQVVFNAPVQKGETLGGLPHSLLVASFVLIVGAIAFGGYLLWRDVQRSLYVNRLRSRFLSSVSHELRTPLTSIRMFAETLRMGRPRDERKQQEYLATIVHESERLARLVDNVLDFSRVEKEVMHYAPEPISPAAVVLAAADTVRDPLSRLGFDFTVEVDDETDDVRVDPDAMKRAVVNLLSNAMKYSGAEREIGLRLKQRGDEILVEVIDHGVGIDRLDQERIFEEFYRVPAEPGKQVPGTGLGLALVNHFAKAHAGRVEVESSPGEGSTFSLWLPVYASELA